MAVAARRSHPTAAIDVSANSGHKRWCWPGTPTGTVGDSASGGVELLIGQLVTVLTGGVVLLPRQSVTVQLVEYSS